MEKYKTRVSKSGNIYRGIIKKRCEYCKKPFKSLKQKTRFCSISCSNKSTHKKEPLCEDTRKCPGCNKILKYKTWRNCLFAIKKESPCLSCSIKILVNTPNYKEKIRKKLFKKRINIKLRCKYCKNDFFQEIKKGNKPTKNFCSMRCRILFVNKSPEKIKKTRLKIIKRIQDNMKNGNQMFPIYNKGVCILFEDINKNMKLNIRHAMNGGEYHIKELGYWVDGYEPTLNLVIEYYENWHEKQKEKDKRRKKERIEFLKCKFIELKEWENKEWYHHLELQINSLKN